MILSATRRFQPTLPARGATNGTIYRVRQLRISTHAPRTGSDKVQGIYFSRLARFQPTLPARGATLLLLLHFTLYHDFNPRSPHGERLLHLLDFFPDYSISTHAPRTGSDASPLSSSMFRMISTHAPRTGSDVLRRRCRGDDGGNFNPRSPHGERPRLLSGGSQLISAFQPTLPARGATTDGAQNRR